MSSIFSFSSGNPLKEPALTSARLLPFAFLIVAALISGGCGLLGGSSTNSVANNEPVSSESVEPVAEAAGESSTEVASGPCKNRYYPIEPGLKRKYTMTTNVEGGDSGLTLEQTAPEDDTFTEVRTLSSGTTVTTPWKCTKDGLRVAEYENFIDSKVGNFSMETLESSGITIPVSWKKGDEWDSTYKIRANIKAGPVTASADGTVTITNQLVSESEKVDSQRRRV